MERKSLRSLFQEGEFNNLSVLRKNSSGYNYITLVKSGKDKSKSANLYFSKRTNEIIEGTFNEGDQVLEFLKDADVVATTNSKGEWRHKISVPKEGNYSNNAQLEQIFGENKVDFDLNKFREEFTSMEAVKTPETNQEVEA